MTQHTKNKTTKRRLVTLRWPHLNVEKTSKAGRGSVLNGVSVSVPAGSTHQFVIEEIARYARIPVESLCPQLNEPRFIRGAVFFGALGDQLDKIARNYRDMQWWISDKGVNVAILPAELPELSPFDLSAGSRTAAHWKNGRLPKEALWVIAKALDDEGFSLKNELQPAQWRVIAAHNSRYSRTPIKNFLEAVQKPAFVRLIRRRLYLARARFVKAQRAMNGPSE